MYANRAGRFLLKDPSNPTFQEKVRLLKGCLHKRRQADFKMAVFVAAAESDDYLNDLVPFPPRFTTSTGVKDINRLRGFIEEIPNLRDIYSCILNNQIHLINPYVVELIFWVMVQIPHTTEEFVEEFINNCRYMENFCTEKQPLDVFVIGGRKKQSLDDFCRIRNVTPATYFYNCRLNHVFKILVNDFSKEPAQSIMLTKLTDPSMTFCGTVWENSDYYSEIRCVAMCSLLPHGSHIMCPNENGEQIIAVYHKESILLQKVLVYPKYFRNSDVDSSGLSWLERNGYNILWATATGVIFSVLVVKYKLLVKVDNILTKCLDAVKAAFSNRHYY